MSLWRMPDSATADEWFTAKVLCFGQFQVCSNAPILELSDGIWGERYSLCRCHKMSEGVNVRTDHFSSKCKSFNSCRAPTAKRVKYQVARSCKARDQLSSKQWRHACWIS